MPVPTPQAYATTNAMLAIGDNGSPEEYDQIAQVGDIGDIGFTANMHRTDSHSLAEPWGSQIPGILMQDDVVFPLWFNPENAQHSFTVVGGIGELARTRTLRRFLYYPAGFPESAVLFLAYVTKCSQPTPVDGVLQLTITLSRTGVPEYGVDATLLTINLAPTS